jgi:Tfp pilus assembly protein PilO
MADLQPSRRKLKIAIAVMVAADLIAAALLFSPLVGSADSRRNQIMELRAELTKKNHEVAPLRGMDQKVVVAKKEIGAFYKDRFASKDSVLTNELGKLASENGVRIQTAHYKEEDPETSGIVPVEIQGSFSGDYLQLVRFINTLERSKMFFEVDGIDLAGESTGPVKLGITIHSYLSAGVS